MSTVVDETTPNLSNLDVPVSDTVQNADGDFNAEPPALPELFTEKGEKVGYIVNLSCTNGISKETYNVKENGVETGDKAAYYTADLFCRVIGAADGRELDINQYNTFIRPARSYTSFLRKGKEMSEIAHLAKLAGLDLNNYAGQAMGEALIPDLKEKLAQKGVNAVQAIAIGQWQWYDKDAQFTVQRTGEQKTGKVVRYNMKNADTKRPDGAYDPTIINTETGNKLKARFVITQLLPLQ